MKKIPLIPIKKTKFDFFSVGHTIKFILYDDEYNLFKNDLESILKTSTIKYLLYEGVMICNNKYINIYEFRTNNNMQLYLNIYEKYKKEYNIILHIDGEFKE